MQFVDLLFFQSAQDPTGAADEEEDEEDDEAPQPQDAMLLDVGSASRVDLPAKRRKLALCNEGLTLRAQLSKDQLHEPFCSRAAGGLMCRSVSCCCCCCLQ